MAKKARWLLATTLLLVPALALAQGTSQTTAPPGPATPTPPAGPGAGAGAQGQAASSATSTAPVRPATGYGWSTPKGTKQPPQPVNLARARRLGAGPPAAVLPGFDSFADGSSRLFVELTKSVPIEERKAAGTITYVMKGTHVNVANNLHSLITVHFNTPVVRARLVPKGGDLLFVVDLRAAVAPTWKLSPAKDGAAILQIDFPAGSYLPGDATAAPAAAPAPAPASSAKPAAMP
jgi:hypothetical protein